MCFYAFLYVVHSSSASAFAMNIEHVVKERRKKKLQTHSGISNNFKRHMLIYHVFFRCPLNNDGRRQMFHLEHIDAERTQSGMIKERAV